MHNPRLANRYAKSLIDIAIESGQLDSVYEDIRFLNSVLQMSREFVIMLESPIIHPDKKYKIIGAITKGRITKISDVFIKLLCNKHRESILPGVAASFIDQYNILKGLHKAKFTTASAVSKEFIDTIVSKIKTATAYEHVRVETNVDDKIIGGFILEMEGKLIDNSIRRNLNDVKKQFENNDYLHKLR